MKKLLRKSVVLILPLALNVAPYAMGDDAVAAGGGASGDAPAVVADAGGGDATPMDTGTTSKDNVTMPNTVMVNGQALKLNGMGTRVKKVVFLKVGVYVAGLYVKTPSKDGAAILASGDTKRLDMQFILPGYHPTASKNELVGAFNEGLEANFPNNPQTAALSEGLKGALTDMKKGDKMSFVFGPDSLEVTVKGGTPTVIPGAAASKMMLTIFIGQNPPTEDLKNGLLGT